MNVRVELLDEPLSEATGQQIDRLLSGARTPDVLGYHARAYQRAMTSILQDRPRHLAAIDDSGEVVGYLPFRERSTELGRVLCALPFFGPNGLVHVAAAAPPTTLELLLRAYRSAAEGALAAVLYTPFLAPVEPIARAFEADDRVEKFMQYLDLDAIAQWPPKRRADIKRAITADLTVRPAVASDLEHIVALHRASASQVGAPIKPSSYLEATLALSLTHPKEVRWTMAERAGSTVACLLTVQGPLTVSYVLPATAPGERSNQPIPLLIDESAAHARRCGARYWNMESSVSWDDSVFKFKERWGARIGSYAILIAYPSGKSRAEAVSEADLKARYPYYFVRPFATVTGTPVRPAVS
jgi:hypothetical protein